MEQPGTSLNRSIRLLRIIQNWHEQFGIYEPAGATIQKNQFSSAGIRTKQKLRVVIPGMWSATLPEAAEGILTHTESKT